MTVRGIEGVVKLVDDCLGKGVNPGDLKIRLRELLLNCWKHNIKVSKRKFVTGTRISFAGFVIDASGGEIPEISAAVKLTCMCIEMHGDR